ncbi:hypothetical protein [Microbulbifer sp. S227A]|uniref:hypothetical protein n=1 Tax=Microbulbifer sp. S227A TaxID=3415131 RepID=UPI003C7E3B55
MTPLPLVLLSLLAGPALAHSSPELHVHETDYMSLVLGLSLIVTALGAAVAIRARRK